MSTAECAGRIRLWSEPGQARGGKGEKDNGKVCKPGVG
eukprot:CAMPEP_0168430948 /NCGR_PEP_ID=MMETSP0228-20121227/38134_1 /TAXON_ID=133427 /ORGANISM="Protoceratium reticulatum, Strain CCCM 535 (=CCMP 1889)" /LENGTH=37 /DNA_ID= /DNA_START= /DNA_END= /DNA_ORIENTATION=